MSEDRALVAQRIKGLREAAEMTAESVAAATGLTAESYLRYESGAADAPVSFLSQLAALYKVEVTALLTGGDAHARTFHVTRRGTGPTIERRCMYHYEALGANFAGKRVEPFIVTVEPTLAQTHLNTHPGQEFNYVISGTLLVTVGNNTLTLEAGDSIYYDATVPHGMRAGGDAPATFLAIITA